ncbi:hypothetical protein [Ralstonia insidiosa]|uniref:Uncharacterized protein n=1 Tax=Ralstonia insidiosa TaxID=190721 RepID=A0A848NU40_9RALS|nr:hypothetical protein [Ralstonia insidiosa]NMV36800.1 hypothetical protein [Ralstonia insidiosa]
MAKKYLTFEDICALSLLQQAIQHEEERHRARMAEIEAMKKTLAALQVERAEIERNGYRLFGESIARDFKSLTLRYSGHMRSDDVRLATALLRSGWRVIDRDDGPYPSPTFRKGRVNLKISCTHAGALEKAEQAIATSTAPDITSLP